MPWWCKLSAVCAVVLVSTACKKTDCTKKAARKDKACPEGFVSYGREARTDNYKPNFTINNLVPYSSESSFRDKGKCEIACVPEGFGTPEEFGECDVFEACGGSPVGDWRWEHDCPYEVPNTEFAGCADAAQTEAFITDGTLTFEEDGTVRFTASRLLTTTTWYVPPQCIEAATDCASLAAGDETCAGDTAFGCACVREGDAAIVDWQGTYTVTAGSLLIEPEGMPSWTATHCVDGDSLVMDTETDDEDVFTRERLFRFIN